MFKSAPSFIELDKTDSSVNVSPSVESILENSEIIKKMDNIKLDVSLDIIGYEPFVNDSPICLSRNRKVLPVDIIDAAILIADMWLDNDCVENDDLSITDLGDATVSIKGTDLSFTVKLDFCSKATALLEA